MALLDHLIVPVASEEDARATCAALEPHLSDVDRVTALYVIEKGGGSIDKAPMEKREADATEFLAFVESTLDDVTVDTRIAYGTDVVETIFSEAAEVGAAAVAFRPRGGSRLVQFLAGDTATKITTEPEIPVLSLPDPTEGEP